MRFKRKKNPGQKPWLLLGILSLLFYGTMLFLTILADDIHTARLPKVTATQPGRQSFTYTLTAEDGTVVTKTCSHDALPKALVDSGKVFTVKTVTENGRIFYYAEPLNFTVDTNLANPEYYAISTNSVLGSTVILSGYEELSAGDEVFLVKENQKADKLNTEDLFQ